MKKTGNLNINIKPYWDRIYADHNKRETYDIMSGEIDEGKFVDGVYIRPSKRIKTASDMVSEGEKSLDIGCGVGTFTKHILAKYPHNECWGVDISRSVVEANKEKMPEAVWYQQHVGILDAVPENYFDVVFSGEVIEHLDDPADLLKDAYNSLKSGGRFILTTPKDEAVRSPEHVWYFSKKDIKELFENNGFVDIEFIDLPDVEKEIIIFCVGVKG